MSDKARWKGRGQHLRGPDRSRLDTVPNSARSQKWSRAIGSLSGYRGPDCWELKQKSLLLLLLLMAAPLIAWGQIPSTQIPAPNSLTIKSPTQEASSKVAAVNSSSPSSDDSDGENARRDLDSCHIHRVTSLPGS